MIYTLRNFADFECEKIKELVKSTSLNYFTKESPFTLQIYVKKSFVKDFSPATEKHPNFGSPESTFSNAANDSGIQPDNEKQLEDLKHDLDQTILKSNKKIEILQEELETKDTNIVKLNSKITS